MTRAKGIAAKKNGRPQVHFVTEKMCKGCGASFTMQDRGVAHPSWFAEVRYCSASCRQTHADRSRPSKDLAEYIASHSQPDQNTGCSVWTHWKSAKGYGYLSIGARKLRAHRVAYELANGPIPKGLLILHSCDNPSCVNPAHLRAGTARENTQDCIARGRRTQNQKATSPKKLMSHADLATVCRAPVPLHRIAEFLGCSLTTSWRLRNQFLNEGAGRG
jgi:hypothetical protein